MTWPIVKLGDVCTFTNGGTPSKEVTDFWCGEIPWISSADIVNDAIQKPRHFITAAAVNNSSTNQVPAGTLLVVTRTGVGKVAITDVDLCFSQDITALHLNTNCYSKYIAYAIKSHSSSLNAQARGATIKGITREVLASLPISLPPLAEQQRIAAILDKAEEIKRKREQAIAKLDELAQSTFVEMFGDPVKNTKNWDLIKLGTAVTKLGSGSTPTGGDASYKSQGISLIRSLNVHDGEFVIKNLAYIDDNQAAKLANVQVEKGDVLLNITGASVARVCRVPDDVLPARVNQHVMIIRPNATLNTLFLERLLLSPQMKRKLLQIGGAGATREAITKAEAEKLEIICPPLKLQIEFENRMKNLILIKEQSLLAINKHEQLLASLQHQAFTTGFRA